MMVMVMMMVMMVVLMVGWSRLGINSRRPRKAKFSKSLDSSPPIQGNKAFSSVGGQTFKPSMEDGLRKHPSFTMILVITTINIVGIKIIVIISVSIMIHDHHDRHNWQWQANP